MRHIYIKPNSGSKSNVGSGSGTKVTSVSKKAGSAKRIHVESAKTSKKRKLIENPSKSRSITVLKPSKETDAEKSQKKTVSATAATAVKKSCVSVKKLKNVADKSKKVNTKSDKKGKVIKRCKVSDKDEENDGPPTLSETFSRITTMVAETVINEKESQRLTESLMAKAKKEPDSNSQSCSKSKGETSAGETAKSKKGSADSVKTSSKKAEVGKKVKSTLLTKSKIAKVKSESKKSKSFTKKLTEKATLDNTENLVKVLKDEEIPLVFGKGIGTRRKSTAGSAEGEQKPETSDVHKSKGETAGKCEAPKKKVVKTATKKVVVKKEKGKSKAAENQIKKASEEMKKTTEKGKDEGASSSKESFQKKAIPKKESVRAQPHAKKKVGKSSPVLKKKVVSKEAVKSPKPKLGSETDGSNSDELTLSIIQKKAKKTKASGEKVEPSTEKPIKRNPSMEEIKTNAEEKVTDTEKGSSKNKKPKIKKEEKSGCETSCRKMLQKKAKDTESDTDEDMELKRIMAKKLGRTVTKTVPEVKKKKPEAGKSAQESDQRAKRLKLFGFWGGPKRHRVASLNAIAKVHCLYENESKGVLAEIEKMAQVMKPEEKKMERKEEKQSKSEKKSLSVGRKGGRESENLDGILSKRNLRGGALGGKSSGKHWDSLTGDSTSTSSASSDEGHSDTEKTKGKKLPLQPSYRQKMFKKEDGGDREEIAKAPKRRRNNEIGITMDLKDMVVRKRMASLNASAILAASYSVEKRSNRKDSSGTSTEDGTSSVEDNDRFFSDEGENTNKSESKKSSEQEKAPEEKNKETEENASPECTEYRHKKHFWKTKVESLKKTSKEKRNSPSPILADFGVEKDLSTTVLEKEKKDELNEDKEKDKAMKFGYPPKKFLEGKLKGKVPEGRSKNIKCGGVGGREDKDERRKYSKRKLCEEDVKNINIEKMSGIEKTDEYEYKSDSDNGQRKLIELRNTGGSNKKVAVIVNQDTDVTITGVYVNSTRSTHHEGFCSIAGMQYRISSTSHTQTEATAVLKTSTASEQAPSPSEPRNCTSPRGHKSYTPLSALSNMQPPAGASPHPHLPPPPHHHHHHLCGIGQHRPPPDHYLGHGPISHQRPMSPLGRRHGCTSAFTAPHCSSHPAPVDHHTGDTEAFGSSLPSQGYFQPAGPLIHHHSSNSTPAKSQNLSSLDSSSAGESQAPPSSAGTDEPAAESTGRSADNSGPPAPPPPPPPPAAHHMGYPRGYPPFQGGYYQGSYYPPPPPQSGHYQPPPPSFHQHYHHHQDLCYPPGYPPSSYPPPPGSYRRFLQPPHGYYSPELTYASSGPPPPSPEDGAQQMVVPGGSSSSYSASLDPYPPPAPYYPGYSPGPGPACYSHPPSSRNLAFIEQTYQSCPCPMQLCPKNVHIGPLTGECKRPEALPLPPVALQLPQEPPGAAGPPSPARGSAGMPPQPSPASHSARPDWDGRTGKSSFEVKWEESKTNLEPKLSKYKTDIASEIGNKEMIQDLSKSGLAGLDKSGKSLDSQWNELSYGKKEKDSQEKFAQGLLAISSREMLLLTARKQEPTEPAAECRVDECKKIKIKVEEASSPPCGLRTLKKQTQQQNSRKRNFVGKDAEESPKRKKLIAKLEEILVNNLEESKRRKKKAETGQEREEDSENKMQKLEKSDRGLELLQKDDENVCGDGKMLKKKEKTSNSKAKLLKDRNEMVEWKQGLETGTKVPGKKEKKLDDGTNGVAGDADKVVNRRKSNQDRSGIFPEAEIPTVRKSKSCSPSRSKTRENSPVRLPKEETARKQDGTKNGKAKGEGKGKGGNLQEHSRSPGKKKSCANGTRGGKQVVFLNNNNKGGVHSKTKKAKSVDHPLSALKKLSSKKGSCLLPRSVGAPKWSNGWSWDSESFDAKVYLTNDEPPVMRKCYTAMRHVEGDVIHPKDCILLKAGPRKIDLPFVAKVAALWENPDDGEMMVSLLWYYRPEHTDQGRQLSDQQDEIFASRHKDINSVACIEDKCFVLTYNEYCRYRKKVKRVEEGVAEKNLPVPRPEQPYFRFQRQPPCVMAPDMVFFCRRVYDFRQKRLLKNPT